ncbi:MAG TPA: polysaccharide biosynthesis C-terminal domain-containing protein, partial [Ferruginibacter sp.]|nr:polysaccharide biosynthesis C-terminal domain-containing protein [Ferruginibacter sp.]
VFTISIVFDTIIIAAVLPDGLALAGIYTLAQNIASLIQAPQRGVISSSIGPLSQAWKNKDLARINRIYHSSSINQLIFSVAMFALIWMNFNDAVLNFHLQHRYLEAAMVFFYIGLMRIVDMGTGVNSQIIVTSTFWRFDFITGIILLALTLPLNYVFTKYYFGVTGPAIANLISLTVYNLIRYWFLYARFSMQPFSLKTLYTLLLGIGGYVLSYYIFRDMHGFAGMILRSALFVFVFVSGVKWLELSPDVKPVWQTMLKKLGIKKGD